MKTAILIVGHIRTWDVCKKNFIESFGHLNPDIFATVYDLQYNYHPAQQKWMNGEADNYLTQEQIVSLFHNMNLIGLDYEKIENVINEYKNIENNVHINFKKEINTILQCRKIIRGIDMINQCETMLNNNYDVIIKIRSDIEHNKFDYKIDEKNVIISNGNVYPNDVIIAASRDNFVKISEFLKSEFFNPIFNDSHLKAPHNLFLRAFNYCGLEVEEKNLMKFVARKSGKQYYTNIA